MMVKNPIPKYQELPEGLRKVTELIDDGFEQRNDSCRCDDTSTIHMNFTKITATTTVTAENSNATGDELKM